MHHRRSAPSSALMTAGETASHQRRRWVANVAMTIVAIVALVAIVAIVAIGGHRGLGCGLVS